MDNDNQIHIFSMNLKYQIELTGKMQKTIANELGISPTSLNNWCREVSMPRMEVIQKLSDYFGITKSELIDEPVNIPKEDGAIILHKISMLNELNRTELLEYLDALIESQRNSSDNNP